MLSLAGGLFLLADISTSDDDSADVDQQLVAKSKYLLYTCVHVSIKT